MAGGAAVEASCVVCWGRLCQGVSGKGLGPLRGAELGGTQARGTWAPREIRCSWGGQDAPAWNGFRSFGKTESASQATWLI